MSLEQRFLQAIRHDPTDGNNLLVYADWLEEQGDPRTEFVRLAGRLGEIDLTVPEHAQLLARCRQLQEPFDAWWAEAILTSPQIRCLRRLTEARFGPLPELYEKQLYRSRCLHPPATQKGVAAAERKLGFPLPPLLGAAFTCLGNGGLLLTAMGLRGGQTGFDDIGFANKDIVTGYQGCVAYGRWHSDEERTPWPKGLVPLYDGLGCGMVDYLDCTSPVGPIWRSDSGHLDKRLDSLLGYFQESLLFWKPPK